VRLSTYVLRRLLFFPPTLIGLTAIVFFVSRIIPGDPVALALGDYATPEMIQAMRHEFALDRPIPIQYAEYLNHVVHADLGVSVFTQRPVSDDLLRALPATVELTCVSLLFAITLGITGGVVAAVARDRWLDHLFRLVAVSAASLPGFWLALMLQLTFALALRLLPVSGRFETNVSPPAPITGLYLVDSLLEGDFERFVIAASHIILPALALCIGATASILRMVRASMLEVLSRDFLTMARAAGISERIIVLKYALKNALIASVTVMGAALVFMFAGALLVETIFDWPGLGLYMYNAIIRLDFQAVSASTLVVGCLVAAVNLITDLLYGVLDPRIRYG
jgi:peptide/nickel transport system permease protein